MAICLLLAATTGKICHAQPPAQLPTYGNPPSPWAPPPTAPSMSPTGGSTSPTYPTPVGTFDPYSSPGFRPSTAPVTTSPYAGISNWFIWGQPAPLPLGTGPTYPVTTSSSSYQNPYAYNSQPMGAPQYPSSVYPNSTPNVLYPGASGTAPLNSTWNFQSQTNPYGQYPYGQYPYGQYPYNANWNSWNNWWYATGNSINTSTTQVVRLCQGPRFRHTWLSGSDGFDDRQPNSLESNDTDVSLVFAIPNLFGSTRPLYIIPSYSQHVWDGPTAVGSDIPGAAFSGFLDSGWESNPVQTVGVELGIRIGVFAAFDAVNSDSMRYQGKAMGRLRLTPTSTMRAGVFYIDRNKIKLLPAVGILWAPNQDTRFDIFFPEPKLSHYLSTLGNSDMWWYLTGYYGGGAWTIQQTDGSNDSIDINDIRLMIGLEFGKSEKIRQGLRMGFVEGGYAFNRELLYRVRDSGNLDLENSFVLRAGFAY
jgi:hypothetical protein